MLQKIFILIICLFFILPIKSYADNIKLSLEQGQNIILYVESLKLSLKDKDENIKNMKYKINGLSKLRQQQEKLFKNNNREIKEISKQLKIYEDLYNLELKSNTSIKEELILTKKDKVVKSFSRTVKSFVIGIAIGIISGVVLVQ